MLGALLPLAIQGIGALLSKKAANKKKKSDDTASYEANKAAFNQRETARTDTLTGLKNASLARGTKGAAEAFTPGMFEKREFTGAPPSQETGSSFFGDALQLGGQLYGAGQDADRQDKREQSRRTQLEDFICATHPEICPDRGVPGGVGLHSNPCDVDPAAPGCA